MHKGPFRIILLAPLVFSLRLKAQDFGSSYDFLLKETSAKMAALGGFTVSQRDDEVLSVYGNPAVLNGKMRKSAAFTVNPSLGNLMQYNAAYADSSRLTGNWYAGIQYLDYGRMTERDAAGVRLGEFGASQYAFSLGSSQKKGNFILGAALRFAGFQIRDETSLALMADMGVFFRHPRRSTTFGFSVRNLGGVIRRFQSSGSRMPVPFNIQAGLSYKLEHMPLRVTATAFYLQKPDIQYVDPNAPGTLDPNGVLVKEKKKISEQIARHLSLGGEFLFHRNFHVRVGYNHLRRKELRPESGAGLTGFSLGCMVNTRPVQFSYTYGGWQPAGGNHFITLVCRFSEFLPSR